MGFLLSSKVPDGVAKSCASSTNLIAQSGLFLGFWVSSRLRFWISPSISSVFFLWNSDSWFSSELGIHVGFSELRALLNAKSSSNITSLLSSIFFWPGMKILHALDVSLYPTKIPFLPEGSHLVLFFFLEHVCILNFQMS